MPAYNCKVIALLRAPRLYKSKLASERRKLTNYTSPHGFFKSQEANASPFSCPGSHLSLQRAMGQAQRCSWQPALANLGSQGCEKHKSSIEGSKRKVARHLRAT